MSEAVALGGLKKALIISTTMHSMATAQGPGKLLLFILLRYIANPFLLIRPN